MSTIIVNGSSGDCYGDFGGFFDATGTGMLLCKRPTGDLTKAWIPFSMPVSKGVVLTSAKITWEALADLGGYAPVRIGCEDADNPSAPASWSDLNGRAMGSSYASYELHDPYAIGNDYTYDITAAVQQIMNRAGFAIGNTLAVMVFDNGSDPGVRRSIAAFEHASTPQPYLTLEFPTLISLVQWY